MEKTTEKLKKLIQTEETGEYIRNCILNLIKMDSLFRVKEKTPVLVLFENAYSILVKHFLEKISEYSMLKQDDNGDNEYRRYGLLQEMDDSITKFWRMLEEETQSLWNANRLINPINPGFATISYVAPKIYLFYSQMLDQLATLYTKCETEARDAEYAFCVNPTQATKYHISILFESREQHGKVCLIYIPESRTAKIRMNQYILLHEMYHVLPITARKREKRNRCIQRIIELLTPQIFGETPEQVLLLSYLLKYIQKKRQGKDTIQSRDEYSKLASQRISKEWESNLSALSGESIEQADLFWADILGSEKEFIIRENKEDWKTLVRYMEKPDMEMDTQRIIRTINERVSDNLLDFIIRLLMNIFREGFADIFAILTMGCGPREYYQWVEEELTEAMTDNIENATEEKLRCIIVSLTIQKLVTGEYRGILSEHFIQEWNTVFNRDEDLKTIRLYRVSKEMYLLDTENAQQIWQVIATDQYVLEIIFSYFIDCVQEWIGYQNRNRDAFDEHRKRFCIAGLQKQEGNSAATETDMSILCKIMGYNKTEEGRA